MRYRLGDICTITKGATGIMKAVPGEYTMVALGEANKTHNEFQFDAKAVIIPLVSSTGHGHASMKRVKYQEGKFALGNILCAVIPKDENFVLAKYLQIYLHWNREELLVSQMKGMANVSLPMNRISDVEVIVPSMEEQRHIVELEAKLVEKENEADVIFADQLTQIESLNQAILQEAVQGKLVPQDPNDEPASELLKRIKAEKEKLGKKEKPLSPIKPEQIPFEIPESWVWCRLGEITNYGSSPKAEPSDLRNDTWVLDLEDIEKTTSKLLCRIRFNERNSLSTKSVFKTGDVLYSKLRPYLDKVIVADEDGVCTTEILPLKCYAGLNPFYLKTALKRPDFVKYVNSKTKGMKMPRLGTKEGQMSLIPLAPLFEQRRIIGEVEKQLAKTKQLKEHIISNQQATEQLLKALLHEAFVVEETKVESEKTDSKIIEFKPTNVDYYKRTVLAAEIVWQLHKEPTLGHLKLQKLIYLCQKTADMQLPTNFLRQAMGPYDPRLMRSIDKQLKLKKWFEFKQGEMFKYKPLEKAGEHRKDFIKYFSAESESIQFLIDTFKTIKSDIVEIVATLYACLEKMQCEKLIFSEPLLIQRFYEWSEEKKKFTEKEISRVFSRMKETGIIPQGYEL